MYRIAPSMAAAPLYNLERIMQELEKCGADMVHFDVEDGSFVPMMTLGLKIISDLRPFSSLPFDVHLMVNRPENLIKPLADMGVDSVSVHYEACPYPRRTLGLIKAHNMEAGLAFNPRTALPSLQNYLPYLDYVVILTTEPEHNAIFLPDTLRKVAEGRKQGGLERVGWMVDGGVSQDNVFKVIGAGADIVVAGRSIFNQLSIRDNLALLKKCVD